MIDIFDKKYVPTILLKLLSIIFKIILTLLIMIIYIFKKLDTIYKSIILTLFFNFIISKFLLFRISALYILLSISYIFSYIYFDMNWLNYKINTVYISKFAKIDLNKQLFDLG